MKKTIVYFISILVAIAAAISVVSSLLFKAALLFPRQNKKYMMNRMRRLYGEEYNKYDELVPEVIELRSHDGLKLTGYYHAPNAPSNKVVILHHGYLANRYYSYQYYDLFLEEGYHILIPEMRSHGDSEGKYATYGYEEQKDLGLWVDYMRDKIGEDVILGFHGHSMGAATVLLYAGNNEGKVDFVIANSSYSSAAEQIKGQMKKFRLPVKLFYPLVNRRVQKECGFQLEEVSPINAIKEATVPTMFIHGTDDILVPKAMSEEMFKVKKGNQNKLLIVEGATHIETMSIEPERFTEEVRSFLKEAVESR